MRSSTVQFGANPSREAEMGTKNRTDEVAQVEQAERIFESWRDVVKAIFGATFIIYLAVFVGRELDVLIGFVFAAYACMAALVENAMNSRWPLPVGDYKPIRYLYAGVFAFLAGSAIFFLVGALIVSGQ